MQEELEEQVKKLQIEIIELRATIAYLEQVAKSHY